MMCLTGYKTVKKCFVVCFLFYLIMLGTVYSKSVFALKLNYGASQSYENTSNPSHVPEADYSSEFEDSIVRSSFFLRINESSSTLNSSVDFKVDYLDYVDDVANDVTNNYLESSFLWFITPGYYSWYLVENIVQTQRDESLLVIEGSSQNVNEFLTGPKLQWKLGGSTLKLDSYINTFTYSETDNDSTNLITNLEWANKMPSGVNLDLKYTVTFVTFNEDYYISSYDQSTVGASLKYTNNTNEIDVFYGKTFLNSDDVSDSVFRDEKITLKRNLTRNSSISITYSNSLSNRDLSLNTGGSVLSGAFVNKESAFSYQRSGNMFGLSLTVSKSDRDTVGNDAAESRRGTLMRVYRVLGARSRLDFTYNEVLNSSQTGLAGFEENSYENRFTYLKKFNNKLSFSLYLSELSVKSDSSDREYIDKKIGLTISIER